MMKQAEVAFRLKTWRMRRGLTQAQLSDLTEWSPQVISFMETGKRRISFEDVATLSAVLNVTEPELLFGADVFPHRPDEIR